MRKGMIVVLNGVSSSGKTTLAKKIQDKSNSNFAWISIDIFLNMWSEKVFEGDYTEMFLYIRETMFHTIKLFSDRGINVIVDSVLLTPYNALEELISLLHDYSVLLVHVTCSVKELRKREAERGDRKKGLAESQLLYLIPQDKHDLTINTSLSSVNDCADKIIQLTEHPNHWTAFKKLCVETSFE